MRIDFNLNMTWNKVIISVDEELLVMEYFNEMKCNENRVSN